jgi:glycyl-tRNA synthetase alpha chain
MPLLSSDALILRTYKVGETSKVVVLLTRERGKSARWRKGARSGRPRYQSALEPLSEVRVGLYGRQGAELLRMGQCELLRSAFRAGERGLTEALHLSYFAELPGRLRPGGRGGGRRLPAGPGGRGGGPGGTDTGVLARYLEAWLLKLHGLYPPLDRCAACGNATGTGGLDYDATPHGSSARRAVPPRDRSCRKRARFLAESSAAAAAIRGAVPEVARALEPFHEMLIGRHLERTLQVAARDEGGGDTRVTLQDIIATLGRYWAERGCLVHQPWDAEVGAGTMHPETFLRVLGPQPWRVAYVQPSRRPADGRYGENPNRLYKHQQYQVILKPAPADVQDVYLQSLAALGIDPRRTTCASRRTTGSRRRSAPGASAGRCCSTGRRSRSSRTSSRRAASTWLRSPRRSRTGLERIAMYLQDVDDVYDVLWSPGVKYGVVRHEEEYQLSRYSFELADADLYRDLFERYLKEGWRVLEAEGGRSALAAYDWALKTSHAFNVLDARGAISSASAPA